MLCICTRLLSTPRCYLTASFAPHKIPEKLAGRGGGAPISQTSRPVPVISLSRGILGLLGVKPDGQSPTFRRPYLALSCQCQTRKRSLALRGPWPQGLPSCPANALTPLCSPRPFPFVLLDSTHELVTALAVQLQYLGRGKIAKAALNPLPVGFQVRLAGVPRWHSRRGEINESCLPFPDGRPQDSRTTVGNSQIAGGGGGGIRSGPPGSCEAPGPGQPRQGTAGRVAPAPGQKVLT